MDIAWLPLEETNKEELVKLVGKTISIQGLTTKYIATALRRHVEEDTYYVHLQEKA